ncbi:MAG: diguanylate cyclase [Thermoanaerobaculia bacterium]
MRRAPFLFFAFLVCLSRAEAADSRDLTKMLTEADRIHATDKVKSRQLLDTVESSLTAASDPAVRAQAQLLECKLSDAPATAYRAVAAGLTLADRAKSVALRAQLLACRASALQVDGRAREAEADFAAAAALAGRAREGIVEAEAREKLAWLQYNRGAMADALTNGQIAYRISTQLAYEQGQLDGLAMMANVYADTSVAQYDRAIEYYRQLATAYEKLGKPNDVADTLYNIGSTFEAKGNPAAAELYYRRALASFEALKAPHDIAYTRCSLGSALMKQGRTKAALSYLNASLAFYENEHDAEATAWVKQIRGVTYRRLGQPQEALRDLAAAREYFETEKNARYLERNADESALVYEQLGDWRNAYAFRKRHGALQQELAVSRRDELSSRLRVQFDAEKKEQENRALARENTLRTAALREAQRNQKLQLAVIALTALLAVALAVLFWRQMANTRRMRTMAMTDELTRLPNRRHIMAAAEMALAEARRNNEPAALIMLDIDRFKRINDTYGHAAGDEILKRVARTCRLTLRPSDQIGRIGGEEFLIVLHGTTSARQAADVAERLRTAVEQLDVTSIAPDLQVTISLGVSVTEDHDANAAIASADSLLYRAKENGRNRVETAVA